MKNEYILFIDGECNLCNRLVRILSSIDKNHILCYSSLTSNYAKNFFNSQYDTILQKNSVIFSKNEKLFFKSDAIIELSSCLGMPFSILSVTGFFPIAFRDRIYDIVAKNRYVLFGKTNYCQLSINKTNLKILQEVTDS